MPLPGLAPLQGWERPFKFEWDQHLLISFIISLLIVGLFVYLAAKLTGESEGYGTALATAFVGNLLAYLVLILISGWLGIVLAIVVWGAVAAGFYRTRWLKGLFIGIVAWLLMALVIWIMDAVAR